MNTQTSTTGSPRRDRLLREHVHDPYKRKHKLPEPTVCPICSAVFRGGRWQWAESWPTDSNQEVCQACLRTQDGFPAGEMTLNGGFVQRHRAEIINLARNLGKEENAGHPLHRIMRIEERPDAVRITTTDIHLPQRIGEALHHAYKGKLDLHYSEAGYFVRVTWHRES